MRKSEEDEVRQIKLENLNDKDAEEFIWLTKD